MTQPLPALPVARTRRRSIWAVFALVGALVAGATAAPAFAEVLGDGPGAISGTITSTDGQAVAGVSVSLSTSLSGITGSTTTDATGYYELSGLPLNDQTMVTVWAQGYNTVGYRFETLTQASPMLTLDYVLTPHASGVGAVSGYLSADGVPVGGTFVSASNYSTGQYLDAVTDASGFYEIAGLPNGEWYISAYLGSQYQTVQSPLVLISDGQQTASADIAFFSYPSGTSSISGVVTDSASGEPIADVQINLSGTDVPQFGNATTNAAGEFAFELLPAGNYYLQFNASGYLALSEELAVAEGETVTASHALVAADATVSGHIQLADGTPVVDAFVQASTSNGLNWAGAATDANGDYVITGIGAVAYTLSVGGHGTPYDLIERTVTGVAGGDVTANFTLVPRTTGSLAGAVIQAVDNAYLEPVCVTLYSAKTKKAVAEQYVDGEHYGSDEFYFPNLKPGKYTVEVRDCDDDPTTKFDKVFLGGVKNLKDATFVTVVAAEDSWGNNVVFLPRSN